jgi:hypothetical protein
VVVIRFSWTHCAMDDDDVLLLMHSPSFLEVEEEEGKTRKNALH